MKTLFMNSHWMRRSHEDSAEELPVVSTRTLMIHNIDLFMRCGISSITSYKHALASLILYAGNAPNLGVFVSIRNFS